LRAGSSRQHLYFDEDVRDNTGVWLAGRRVQNDRPVGPLVVDTDIRLRDQCVNKTENKYLEQPVPVDQEGEAVRLAGDEDVSRAQTVEEQPRKCVRIPVVFVESVVRHPVRIPSKSRRETAGARCPRCRPARASA
jgi:hypothetical protein